MIRVRFPPSPTGIPHIGNTRTALFNYLFAKHNNGVFILRIEDTDRARLVAGAEDAIKEILNWLGLAWDEFYKQSQRLDLYKKKVGELLQKGLARQDEGAIRFIIPKGKTVSWEDAVGKKIISFQSSDIEDFVILKSDEFPTYHLANVVDDHDMQISHVIRGDEWISSTPKHIMLYEAFGWKPPIFAHLPVILGPDKTKLSKRHEAKSVLDYRDEGYLKEALLNFMVLLGWNPGGDKEIMTISEMIKLFDLKDVNTSPSIFDVTKLDWLNGHYIRQLSTDELKSKIKMQNAKLPASQRGEQVKMLNLNEETLDKLVTLAQTRIKTLSEFENLVKPIAEEPEVKLDQDEKKIAEALLEQLKAIKQWNKATILAVLKDVLAQHQIKMSVLYKIFTGQESGLPLPEVLEVLGKEEILKRLGKTSTQ